MGRDGTVTRRASPLRDGRERLIETAMMLFAKDGFDAVSTKHIVLGAGLTIGSLYHHFASKEAVYEAVIRAALDALPPSPTGPFGATAAEARAAIEQQVAWFAVAISAETIASRILRREFADPRLDQPISTFAPFVASLRRFHDSMALIAPHADVALAEAAIISLLFGIAGLHGLRRIAPSTIFASNDPQQIARSVCAIIFDGIAAAH